MVDQKDLRALQMAVLDVYRAFAEICKKHNLRYYLIGGSVIGSIRHNGFIPWDDDVDITMPIRDYNQLIEILKAEKNFPFLIEHYQFEVFTTGSYVLKLCNPKVKCGRINGDKTYVHSCFLSVFPLNNLPDSSLMRKLFKLETKAWFLYLRFVRSAHNGVESDSHSTMEKVGIKINKLFEIGKRTTVRSATMKLDMCLQRYKNKQGIVVR